MLSPLASALDEPEATGAAGMVSGCYAKPQLVSPWQTVDLEAMELQSAKEILAEIFRTRSEDIEDMIQRHLAERS